MSRFTAKVVQFDVQVGEGSQTKPLTKGNSKNHMNNSDELTPLQQSVRRITAALDQCMNDQRYLRIRETRHRDSEIFSF
jgi:hypothetical protein